VVLHKNSIVLNKIKNRLGESTSQINDELKKRKVTLEWMVKNEIRQQKDVAANIMEFYSDPNRFYEKKRLVI